MWNFSLMRKFSLTGVLSQISPKSTLNIFRRGQFATHPPSRSGYATGTFDFTAEEKTSIVKFSCTPTDGEIRCPVSTLGSLYQAWRLAKP